jgi:hypothetical protein
MHLHHLTLQTGHSRRSERSEIVPHARAATAELLREALATGRAELPIEPAGYWMRTTPHGRCLLVTVMHGDELPLVTYGVATHAYCGARTWRGLLDCDPLIYGSLHGDPATQPQAPWCAARLEPGLAYMPEAAAWLGDMERCIAWAWLDRTSWADGACPRCKATVPTIIDRGDVLCARCRLVL